MGIPPSLSRSTQPTCKMPLVARPQITCLSNEPWEPSIFSETLFLRLMLGDFSVNSQNTLSNGIVTGLCCMTDSQPTTHIKNFRCLFLWCRWQPVLHRVSQVIS